MAKLPTRMRAEICHTVKKSRKSLSTCTLFIWCRRLCTHTVETICGGKTHEKNQRFVHEALSWFRLRRLKKVKSAHAIQGIAGIVIALVVIIVVGGILAFLYLGPGAVSSNTTTTTSTTQTS